MLARQLRRWQEAHLISTEQAQAIWSFEHQHQRPWARYGLLGLGGLSIGLGIISLIAANWDEIPPSAKLCANALWMLICAGSVLWAERRENVWRESTLVIFFLSVLGSIGLIGQIYHLSSAPYRAILAWWLVTTPLLWYGRTRLTAWLWLLAGLWALGLWVFEWLRWYRIHWELWHLILSLHGLGGLLCLLSQGLQVKSWKPNYAEVLEQVGSLFLCSLLLGSQVFWYERADATFQSGVAGLLTLLALALMGLNAWVWKQWRGLMLSKWAWAFGGSLSALAYLPYLLGGFKFSWFGALLFIVCCLLGGAWALEQGWTRWYELAISLAGLRLIMIYFEIFGSLMATGLGMIFGGFSILFLSWFWMKYRHYLREFLILLQKSPPRS